jgi:flagella basal body P-ring formation protein FlgA
VQVTWRDGDESLRQTVWFNVTGQRPALLAAVDVKRNESLRDEVVLADEHADWVPDCQAVTSKTSMQGMRLRKALRAGEPICAEDMEPKPLVARGERVTVRARAGLVTVMLDGIAEQDGNLGDQLPVRNPTSGESYMAAVAAEGEVVVRQ